jgi:hypothetical protein
MKKLMIIAAVFMLSSCSSGWHIRQAIKKDPVILLSRSFVLKDTVYSKEIVIRDSFLTAEVDTIFLERDRYWTKVVRVRDSIYVDGGCKSDTVYRDVIVELPPRVEYIKQEGSRAPMYVGISIFLLILLVLLLRLMGK